MLDPAKIKIFAVMSIVMHVAFAVLFANTTLSFPPPQVKVLSLTIMTREGASGEIIQSEAAWPMPRRVDPGFSPAAALKNFGDEAIEWMDYEAPSPSTFRPVETLTPMIDLKRLAAKAHEPPPPEIFSYPAPEMKKMPLADFALGPAVPEILESD